MPGTRAAGRLPRVGLGLLLVTPGVLVGVLSFNAGGFFPGATALAAVAMALLLVGRLTLATHPFSGLSGGYIAGASLLALLAGWTLLSANWSESAARAFIEFDRTLLYLLAFLVTGAAGRTPGRVRWVVRGVALAAFVVCLCGLITRVLPEIWSVSADRASERLDFPLTYRNALGILAALGLVLGFGISSDRGEHPVARVLGAAALPVLGATLLFTFSRGAMAAGGAGLLGLVVLARSVGVVSALVAAVPAALAVKAAYAADLLASDRATSPAAVDQGQELALIVALCTAGAAAMRVVLLLLDRRAARPFLPRPLRHPGVRAMAGAAVLAVLAGGAIASGAIDRVSRQYDRTVQRDQVGDGPDQRARLVDPGNGGRLSQWRVALRESSEARLHGTGAGTYALLWDLGRGVEYDAETVYQVEDAHSLYVEMLAELGIVGIALLGLALLLIIGAFAWRARGPDRVVFATLFGAAVTWSLHAAVDWDWEMPAVSLWLFAAGGLVLAREAGRDGENRRGLSVPLRVVAALGVLLVAVIPARVYLSEAPLRDAQTAFAAKDCATAIDRGLDSVGWFGERPEPFAIIGFCDIRLGYPRLAVQALENAVQRDPENWEFHYGLALVRGAAGMDPRPAARVASRLNPMSRLARETAERFEVDDPRAWRRRALVARLPTD